MTIQSFILLSKLKRAQINEAGTVYVDREKWILYTVRDSEHPFWDINIQKYKYSFDSIIEYLKGYGLIRTNDPLREYIEVTHAGWRIWQTILSRLAWFLFSSILVPIFVSALTALVALWIAG